MRILLVGQVHDSAAWRRQNEEECRRDGGIVTPFVVGQGQYFWWRALTSLGHEVAVERYSDPARADIATGRRVSARLPIVGRRIASRLRERELQLRNRRLLAHADRFDPDLVMVSGGTNLLRPETIAHLATRTHTRLVYLNGTAPVLFASPEEKAAAPLYDLVCTNDRYHAIEWTQLGARRAVALPVSACDPEYHRRIDASPDRSADICFVGRLAPARLYAERVEVLRAIADLGLGIWTNDEETVRSDPVLRNCYRGRAHGTDMLRVISSAKIALNLHGCTMQAGGNLRTFEIAATGTMQIVDRHDAAWFGDGTEIVSFSDTDDLRRKLQFHLANPDDTARIGAAGQARAYAEHTYADRMRRLIELAGSASERTQTCVRD